MAEHLLTVSLQSSKAEAPESLCLTCSFCPLMGLNHSLRPASDPSAEPLLVLHAQNSWSISQVRVLFPHPSVIPHRPSPHDLTCLSLEFIQSSHILIMSILLSHFFEAHTNFSSHFQPSSFQGASLQGLFFNTQYIPIIFKQVKFTLYYSKDPLHF